MHVVGGELREQRRLRADRESRVRRKLERLLMSETEIRASCIATLRREPPGESLAIWRCGMEHPRGRRRRPARRTPRALLLINGPLPQPASATSVHAGGDVHPRGATRTRPKKKYPCDRVKVAGEPVLGMASITQTQNQIKQEMRSRLSRLLSIPGARYPNGQVS